MSTQRPGDACTPSVDVTDAAGVERAAATTVTELGGIDILIGNAGISAATIRCGNIR